MNFLKFSLSILLGLLLVAMVQVILSPRTIEAAPAYQLPTTQTPFFRYLDTAGNGTGTKIATGTYTSTRFYLQPPTANVYAVQRLIVSIEDSAVITPSLYGSVTITNGVVIRRVSGSTVITLTDGVTLSNNLGWRRLCDVEQTNITGVTNQLQAVCDFSIPIRLNGDQSERLEVLLQDDFSGLDGHYFVAEGYKE